MSRALDPETASSLQSDDHKTVYSDIAAALCPQSPQLLEIELLGKSHPLLPESNLLQDGPSIAIPKLKLVQAFIFARQLFFQLPKPCPEDRQQELLQSSAVILLMDPEHLTAANARKRLIQKAQRRPKTELRELLKHELLFLDSYLTSRLHRHTKSPTLWGHRRWILEVFQEAGIKWDLERDLKEVVLIAAERHPRNYYSWLHMRWLLQNSRFGSNGNSSDVDQEKILCVLRSWCLRHPADTSGFSFLLFYLSYLESSRKPPGSQPCDASSSICKEVLGLAVSFKWSHESVWVFLRTLVASGEVQESDKTAFFSSIHTVSAAHQDDVRTQSILQAAKNWCVKYKRRLA